MAEIQRTTETTVTEPVASQPAQTATPPTGSQTTQTVTQTQASPGAKVEMIIYYLAGILITLLAFRFVLVLLGANATNGFADFIYSLSYPFVAPFFGLFGYTFQAGQSRLEIETLIAMAVYALIAYGIARLVSIGRA